MRVHHWNGHEEQFLTRPAKNNDLITIAVSRFCLQLTTAIGFFVTAELEKRKGRAGQKLCKRDCHWSVARVEGPGSLT